MKIGEAAMKYSDGTEAVCGDIVEYNNHRAQVVANVDTREYLPEYKSQFEQLLISNNGGLLVYTENVGVVAFFYPSEKIRLIERKR